MRFYFYTAQDILVVADGVESLARAGQIFWLTMDTRCQIFALGSQGVLTLTRQRLVERSNNQLRFFDLGQDMLCEILPFDCQGECESFRLKSKYIKLYNLGERSMLAVAGKRCIINAKYNTFEFKSIEKNKKNYYILESKPSKWLLVLSDEKTIYNGRYIDYEVLGGSIKVYSHQPNVYNVGRVMEYNFAVDRFTSVAIRDTRHEMGLVDSEFAGIYFMEAIMCGRTKLAYSRISYELKSSITEEILAQYFGEIDDYIYLPELQQYVTLKNNNIVGVYHIVVNNGLIASIY